MDVELLSKMIYQLIQDRDVVALPGLGYFSAEFVPASFSDKGFTINPPYRKLSFVQRDSDDSSLTVLYARSNEVGTEKALNYLKNFMRDLKLRIETEKVVALPGLGCLRATKDNSLFFVPEEGLDIFPEGKGLEPLSLKYSGAALSDVIKPVPAEPVAPVASEEQIAGAGPEVAAEEKEVAAVELEVAPEEETSAEPKKKSVGGTIILIIVLTALALALFRLVAVIDPELVDSILYSQEELELLKRW